MTTDDDEVQERRFDWALRETLGGERAPDVAVAVRRRFAAGEQVDDSPRPPALRRWLAAAAVLLGFGVVTAVWLTARSNNPATAEAPAAPGPQDPGSEQRRPLYKEVVSLPAIAELPPDARAVELRNLGDDAVAALVQRCPELRHLRIFASTDSRRPSDPQEPVSITDAALPTIGALSGLQTLELNGTDAVTGASLRALERLPLLQKLALTHFDLADAALQTLPRLPSLRRLDLAFNHGFKLQGMSAIGQCPGLVQLGLLSCSQLTAADLAPLARLMGLQDLDLSDIGSMWRGGSSPQRAERAAAIVQQRVAENRQSPAGVTVEAIAHWPQLRTLRLRGAQRLQPGIGAHLRNATPGLRELDLGACNLIDDVTVSELVALRSLTKLDLILCAGISEHCLPLLRESAVLREVHLDGLEWMTLAHAETLFASGKQVVCSKHDDDAFNQAMRALAAKYPPEPEPSPWETVHSLAELAALPDDAESIAVRNLGDEACRLLARRTSLRRLQLVRSDVAPTITDASLEFLVRLPALDVLELYSLQGVDGSFLRQLGVRHLRELKLVGMQLAAGALVPLRQLEVDSLVVIGCQTLTDADLAAIARCRRLRHLDLESCPLAAESIARLGALTGLEELNLTNTGGTTDRALAALEPLTNLRRLGLRKGTFTHAGLQSLRGMGKLQVLDLGDNPVLPTAALLAPPVGLRDLRLDRCHGLDAEAGPLLRDRFPSLRTLALSECKWLDDAGIAAVLELPQLESLAAQGCPGVTAATFAAIRRSPSLRQFDIANCGWFTDAMAQQLRGERPDLVVQYRVW